MSIPAASAGLWSASPTPFHEDLSIDRESVGRIIEHHLISGVHTVMIAGTCGEGPWMPDADIEETVGLAVSAANGKLRIAVQVTDNSAARMLARIDSAAVAGAQLAVMAQPYFLLNATAERLTGLYMEVLERSALPVCFYHRGKASSVPLANSTVEAVLTHTKVVAVKDSSSSDEVRELLLRCRRQRPDLLLVSGDEFRCIDYLKAGYDGLFLGGAIITARRVLEMMAALEAGRMAEALRVETEIHALLYEVYGGKDIRCWLTGLKYYLVQMGLFGTSASYLKYPLLPECREAIERRTGGRSMR